jgi:hypothetical protein
MVHWWMLVPSAKDYYVSNIQEISKSIAAHGIYNTLVWTPCLMHMCVYIWRYILQNYNYKPLYISHSMGTLAAENLDVCSACDLWDSNIQRPWEKTGDGKYMLGLLLILISKSWGCPPPGARHAFPRQRHMGRGGVIYYCQRFLPCMMPSMDVWWDEWIEKASRKTTTTSFTICNGLEIPLIVTRSIYPDFHIQGGAKSFSDCLICMVGASHPK